jgi:hypothetical protein
MMKQRTNVFLLGFGNYVMDQLEKNENLYGS